MQVPCPVYIFDFDGVLIDSEGEPRRVGVEALRQAAGMGRVYILSGRPPRDRGKVLGVLRSLGVLAVVEDVILGRGRGVPEEEYKYERALEILSTEGCILEVHDDNPRVLDRLSRLARGGLVLHYNGYCTPVRGHTTIQVCREARGRHGMI